jgi:polyisoprenoid-binding protein YceI
MKKLTLLAALLTSAALQCAHAADWKMDPAGSRLDFAATFEKVPAPGVFKEFDARLRFDADKPAGSRLDVSIKISSADMNSADINKAIAGPEWFDFARHPQAEFHSTDIRRSTTNPQAYVARGTLTLKGVQQPVELQFTWNAAADGPIMEGGFTAKRAAFGIGTGEWAATDVIGPDVTVKFRVRLRKAA